MTDNSLVERLESMIKDGTVFATWTPTLREAITALSTPSSEEVSDKCAEFLAEASGNESDEYWRENYPHISEMFREGAALLERLGRALRLCNEDFNKCCEDCGKAEQRVKELERQCDAFDEVLSNIAVSEHADHVYAGEELDRIRAMSEDSRHD